MSRLGELHVRSAKLYPAGAQRRCADVRPPRRCHRLEELAISFRRPAFAALQLLCACPSMAVLERDTLQRRLLAAGQLLGWLPEGNAVGAAAGHGPSPAADKGPVQALPLGPAGQQLQELWRLLAAWPQLTELEPTEMQGRLPALASALP